MLSSPVTSPVTSPVCKKIVVLKISPLIMFFGAYFDAPYEGDDINLFFNYISKANFSTLKSNVNEYNAQIIDRRTNKVTTITNEVLRSEQEVRIANFLYLNQIDYAYEEIYPYHILKAKKPYTPDFCIRQGEKIAYIEHFGITESGQHSFYSIEELNKYKREIFDDNDINYSIVKRERKIKVEMPVREIVFVNIVQKLSATFGNPKYIDRYYGYIWSINQKYISFNIIETGYQIEEMYVYIFKKLPLARRITYTDYTLLDTMITHTLEKHCLIFFITN